MVEWYYSEHKRDRQGPVTHAELARKARDLAPGSKVWRSGLIEWEPLERHFAVPHDEAPEVETSGPWSNTGPGSDTDPAPVEITEAVADGWRRWSQLRGRSNRAHYWFWVLFCFVMSSVLGALDDAVMGAQSGALTLVFGLVTLVPSVTVAVRRLHDRGRSGWWLLLWVVPVLGWIILLIWFASRGTPGPNRYGRRV